MTLTFELDLDGVKMNQLRSFFMHLMTHAAACVIKCMKKDRSNVRKAAHTSKSEQIKRYNKYENVLNEVDRCLKRQLT